ncbi:MAG: alpha-galactosidase [Armatimonadetes bacterium]|nr:alpha-galactosidase [Armatimonadota bacterium]
MVFVVRAGGKELFRSELLKEGVAGVPVAVDPSGAVELELLVEDGGDGIGCDQADWAEARVTLADGTVLWLADLPLEWAGRPEPSRAVPFAFSYGGKPSAELLPHWDSRLEGDGTGGKTPPLPDGATPLRRTLTWRDPATGLEVRCEAVHYADFPVVEWTVWLKNTGAADTPLIENLQALDAGWQRTPWPPFEDCEFFLHHWVGTPCTAADYHPYTDRLGPSQAQRFANPAGRPSDSVMPYFDLAWPSQGLLLAVGWPGQWAAEFRRDGGTGLRVVAGQELTHFVLHPGEEVRTPRMALLFWYGDRLRAHNLWRRWMLAHVYPQPLQPTLFACSSHQFGEMIHANEANQIEFVDRYHEEKLGLDYWWMDAGWYPNQSGWPNTGTWEVDPARFPRGLKAITDHVHALGMKSIVWFEPERVTPGTWLYEHPDWLLGRDGEQKLLNLGHPAAREWLTDHVDQVLTQQGIDLYRQDFNMDPLGYWRANDAPDRQGITENYHVTGYLAYWDELRRRHPGMLIDSCASGGRRNDLETLRRAVPLLRSDYIQEPVGNQGHTWGAASWFPFMGTGTDLTDPYDFRSTWCSAFIACWDVRRKDLDYDLLRRETALWRKMAPFFLCDYYPLTGYSLQPDVWIGWQWDRPETGEGVVQIFRRAESPYETARFRLHALDPAATYRVTDLDHPDQARSYTGEELTEQGLPMALNARPEAGLLMYGKE